MGKPVIATYLPGIREYLLDTETGNLVEGNNPSAVAESIDYLWRHPEKTEAMGRCGRLWVCDNFTLERWLSKMNDLLDDLTWNQKNI